MNVILKIIFDLILFSILSYVNIHNDDSIRKIFYKKLNGQKYFFLSKNYILFSPGHLVWEMNVMLRIIFDLILFSISLWDEGQKLNVFVCRI